MSKNRNRQNRRNTDGRPKPKFQEQRQEFVNNNPVRPLNAKQRYYMELLESKDIIIATGHPGTSKTYLPTALACDALRTGRLSKVIFSRPNISNSKSLGFFTGDKNEKMEQWLAPVISVAKERMGVGGYEIALGNERVSFQPLETIKGLSVNDGWLIVDEAEDLSIDEVKKVITRVGKGSKLILAGDITQSELKEKSGLLWLINFVQRQNLGDVIGHVDFNNPNEIVRSDVVKRIILAMGRDEKEKR